MKQNWIHTLSLILCLVLLVLILGQNQKMKQRHEQLESEIHQLRMMLSDEIRSLSSTIERQLEDEQRIIEDYTLQPKEISRDDHALLADMSITLKEWFPDTQVTLFAKIGDAQTELTMETDKNGTFTAQIAIPLEELQEIGLTAQISGGGRTRQETAGSWSDISMLLPLRNTGSGWDGPSYHDGILSSSFAIYIGGREGMPGPVKNPRFQVYRNGELVQTIPAVIDPYSTSSDSVPYTVDSQGNRWHLNCEPGDTIDIRFLCEDEYGLGYDFLFANWLAERESSGSYSGAEFQSGNNSLQLYWPE